MIWLMVGLAGLVVAVAAVVLLAVVLAPPTWLVRRRRGALARWAGLEHEDAELTDEEANRLTVMRHVGGWAGPAAGQRVRDRRIHQAAAAEERRRIRADAVRQQSAVTRRAQQRRRRRRSR